MRLVPRTVLAIAVVFAIGLVLLWQRVGHRDHDAPRPAEERSLAPTVEAHPAIPKSSGSHDNPARPELPPPGTDASTTPLTVDQTFAAELVDEGWKQRTEPELRKRLGHLPRPPTELACRRSQCKLTFVGDVKELAQVMDELERERTLGGIARSMMLTAPEPRADGTMALHAYARFDRD